jgi:hypothetical protein
MQENSSCTQYIDSIRAAGKKLDGTQWSRRDVARRLEARHNVAMAAAPRPRSKVALLLLLMTAAWLVPCARPAPPSDKPSSSALTPAARIPLPPLGFTPPSLFYLTARTSAVTVDFIDKDHLLFTFRKIGLLRRVSDDLPDDEDQLIQAVVLDIATGKTLRQAAWRMHDHSRYLWALSDGKFLVRVRNTLYLTDSSLQLKPFLTFIHTLVCVQLSPDRRFLTVESEEAPEPAASVLELSTGNGLDIPPRRIIVGVYDTDAGAGSHQLLLTAEAHHAVLLPVVKDGVLEAMQASGEGWRIREVPFVHPGQKTGLPAKRDILAVRANCNPSLLPLSETVVMTGCSQQGEDSLMTAIDLDGHVLWNQWWQAKYLWHSFAFSTGGDRYAMGSLPTGHPLSPLAEVQPEDVIKQLVGVFETTTGKLVLLREADPIVSAGQNFALSADGQRFAILRDHAIEVYDLPPAAPAVKPDNRMIAAKK